MIGVRWLHLSAFWMASFVLISFATAADDAAAVAKKSTATKEDGLPEQAAKWFRLARYYESDRQFDEAGKAIAKALELAPNSVPCLLAAAKIQESQNNLLAAIETNTKLATIDRRYRTEHLKKVAQIETRLGRREKALQAGRDVLASAPGNPDAHEFFAQLCFQLGAADEGLETLRRLVRANPSDPRGLQTLANALAEQFRTDEAIELFWRAFEKGEDIDAKLGVVQRLADLYLQTNQFDKLTDRFERLRRESKEPRELTICLAQAYQQAGDDGTARQELEKLLTDNTRDTMLLQQLVKLCESSGDIEEALKYQQQINKVAPGREGELRLSQLLARSGDTEQSAAILTRLTSEEKDPEQLLKSLDTLLGHGKRDEVAAITARLLRDQPKNWELLYREGNALAEAKPDEAVQRFQQLLKFSLPDDEQDTATKARKKREAAAPRKTNTGNARSQAMANLPASILRMQMAYQIRSIVGLQGEGYGAYSGVSGQQVWMPADFGQARMAAEAWLLSIATKKGTGDDYLAKRREAWQSKKEDSRAAWDWYYLQIVRQEGKELYEATKALSLARGANNEAKTLYLQGLAARGSQQANVYVDPEEAAKQSLEPLPNDEVEHMLACYDAVRGGDDQLMIYYSGRAAMQTVMTELRRAKREDQAKKIYDDALAAATAPDRAAMLLMTAMQEHDTTTMAKLMEVIYPDDSTGTASPNPNSMSILSYLQTREYHGMMLGMLMAGHAEKKELAEQPKLFEKFLAKTMRETAQAAASGKKKLANSQPMFGSRSYYQIFTGTNWNRASGEQVDFPAANEFFDHALLQLLRQMFVNHKNADKLADLRSFFQKQAESAEAGKPAAMYWNLGHAYLEWWSDHRDEALAVLGKAVQAMPESHDMRLQLATLLEKQGDAEGALAIVNQLQPLDHQTLQSVETMALRLSVNTGDLDRARQAAERLFGLRLDANLQVQLAQQMFQLGMTEMAESVMSRARRQAGNKTAVLINLMQQYSAQNKPEVAAQIAYQLLRRTPQRSASSRMYGGRTEEDQARQQALVVLNRTGRLPEMIAKLEKQLEKTPESTQIIEMLGEYYTASGQQAKAQELVKRLAGKKTNDPAAEFDLALKLLQAGDAKSAVEKFESALKKQPQLVGNRWHEVENAFRAANKSDELYAAVEQMDLKIFRQNPWMIGNMLQNMFNNQKQKERAIRIFKKAWDAMPDRAGDIMQYVSHVEDIWKMPDIYDYLQRALIPPATVSLTDPWRGANSSSTSYTGEGRMETMATRMLKMAKDQKKLTKLREDIEAGLAKHKNWLGGQVLLAIIQVKEGRHTEAFPVISKLLDEQKQMPTQVRWLIGQEIDEVPDLVPLAMRSLESAISAADADNYEFEWGPARRLIALYTKVGKKTEARDMLLKNAKPKDQTNRGYDPEYAAYRQINQMRGVAAQLHTLGYSIDAIKIYREISPSSELFQRGKRHNGDYMKQEIQRGLSAALAGLKPESLPELLAAGAAPTGKDAASKTDAATLDMLLIVEPAELDKAQLQSLVVNLLTKGAKDKPAAYEQSRKALGELRQQRPDDLTVSTLQVLSWLAPENARIRESAAKNTGAISPKMKVPDAEIRELVARVNAVPLPQAADGHSLTTEQRQSVKSQVALWLVARECFEHDHLRDAGNVLAERALTAAKMQPATDQVETLAILREWGQLALQNGDFALGEKRWGEMLEIVLPRAAAKVEGVKKADAGNKKDDAATSAKPAKSSSLLSNAIGSVLGLSGGKADPKRPTARPITSPIPTPGQFDQATQIARLAARNGLTDLSLRAVREALRNGPPMERLNAEQFGNAPASVFVSQSQEDARLPETSRQIEERLTELETLWRSKRVSEAAIFETLLSAVFPEARPNELFLYPRPLAYLGNGSVRSVGLMLARAAALAKQADKLRERLQPKLDAPASAISARVLAAQLAAAERNSEAAQEHLAKLRELLTKAPLQTSNELAAHAALPATTLPKLPDAAVPLLEQVVAQVIGNVQNPNEEPARALTFQLTKFYLTADRAPDAKKRLDDFLVYLGPVYARYGGDYGTYRRREVLLQIAGLYAAHRRFPEALDFLGQFADIPLTRNYGSSSSAGTVKMIASGVATLSAAERYDVLKKWSLPTEGRQSIRSVAAALPEASRSDAVHEVSPNYVTSDTGSLLIEAAREVGKLDELRALVQPAAEKNVENAKMLWHQLQIARGEGTKWEPELKKFADERRPLLTQNNNRSDSPLDEGISLGRAALRAPGLYGQGVVLQNDALGQAFRTSNQPRTSEIRRELALGRIAQIPQANYAPSADPGLKHWVSGSLIDANRRGTGPNQPWWIAHEGLIAHNSGADQDELFFAYPLTGKFEFSTDVFMGSWGEGNLSFGGLLVEAFNGGGPTWIHSASESESIMTHDPLDRLNEFNRYTIRVDGKRAEYIVNGHLVYTDEDASPSSPFVALTAWAAWQTAFKNPTITGEPIIPREVSLVSGDRLDGWVTSFFNESQPPRVSIGKPDRYGRERDVHREPNADFYDWAAENGQILGRRLPASANTGASEAPSRTYYHRPLRNGETVRYEFFHDPTADLQVHPTLGRLAMLLSGDGVKLFHFRSRTATDAFDDGGSPEDFVVAEDSSGTPIEEAYFLDAKPFRRGPSALPLKANDWNAVSLSLDGGVCKLSLNGEQIFERPFVATHDLHFGFYHDKSRTAAKIRNVVLTGDWPTSLTPELRGELLARRGDPEPAATRQAKAVAIGELFHQKSVREVVRSARAMPPAERFEFLARWVIPNEDHLSWRLYGEFTPTHPAPSADKSLTDRTGRRVAVAGEFESPVTELFAVAKELNKLDELGERLLNAPAATVGDVHARHDTKARMTMAVLMSLATANVADARKAMLELHRLSVESAVNWPEPQCWPEFVAVAGSLHEPTLWPLAELIAKRLVDQNAANNQGIWWESRVRHLNELVRERRVASTNPRSAFPSVAAPRQWHPYGALAANDRSSGLTSRWEIVGGELQHRAGLGYDLLSFQSPLRGSFEVNCELPMHGWREKELIYGTKFVRPTQPGKSFVAGSFLTEASGGNTDHPPIHESYAFRLVVEPGKVTSFVNGHKLHEQPLDADADPWLVFRSQGHFGGFARNVRITGEPVIPTEIFLSRGPDLSNWLNVYHQNPADNEPQPNGGTKARPYWDKSGDEILGPRLSDSFAGSQIESVLHYHRPMAEDGEIEYEFFHVAGRTLVHPSLDRLAFLLHPDGVAVHWITDGAWEFSGLSPDNVTVESSNRRGPEKLPLKENDWNTLKLRLKGDTASVTLNDELVFERTLEPTNQRNFGLFRFADQTEARVRNVVYRGDWPKTLPKVEEQELAQKPARFEFTDAELPKKLSWNFVGNRPAWARLTFDANKLNKFMQSTPEGLLFSLPAGREPSEQVGIESLPVIRGDFEALVGFKIRKIERVELPEGWKTPGVDLTVRLDSGMDERVYLERRLQAERDGGHGFLAARAVSVVPGQPAYSSRRTPTKEISGRMKIIRRGSVVSYLAAAESSNDWALIEQVVASPNEATTVSINVRSFHVNSPVEVLLTDWSIRAADVLDETRLQQEKAARAAFAPGQLPVTRTWNFQGDPPKNVSVIGLPLTHAAYQRSADGLKISMRSGRDFKNDALGVQTIEHFRGDFEITASFAELKTTRSEQAKTYKVPGVDLGIALDQPLRESLKLERRHFEDAEKGSAVKAGDSRLAADGKTEWSTINFPWTSPNGRLRIVRKGTTAYFLIAAENSDEWRLLRERPISTANVVLTNFLARNFDPDSSVEVTLKEFTIRSEAEAKP